MRVVPAALLGASSLCFLGALGLAITALAYQREVSWTASDATAHEILSGVPTGTTVWLRSMRDRTRPLTLEDGLVYYPTQDTDRVMVEWEGTSAQDRSLGAWKR